jgi:hypothetical protein
MLLWKDLWELNRTTYPMIQKTLLTLLLSLPLAQSVLAGHIYWTDRRSNQRGIRRMTLAGGSPTTTTSLISLTNSQDCRGIAVNVATNQIYYGVGTNLARAAMSGASPTNIITGRSTVMDVKWNAETNFLYWADQTAGRIQRAPASTWTLDTAVWHIVPDAYYFDFLTASAGDKLVWGNSTTTMATVGVLAITDDGPANEAGFNGLRGIAIDDTKGMVYWAERDSFAIFRAPLARNNQRLDLTQRETVYSGLDTPHGVEIDLLARKIYWVDSGTNARSGLGAGGVSRGDMDAPRGPQEVLIATTAALTTFQGQPWDLDLDLRSATYNQWVERFFANAASAADKQQTADPDRDGLNNSTEYALCTPPLLPNPAPISFKRNANGSLELTWRQIGNNTDLTVTPQVSTDLANWPTGAQFTAPTTLTSLDKDALLTKTATTLAGGTQRLFVRLNVSVTP